MISVFEFFGLFIFLFLLSKSLSGQLGLLIFRLTESREWTAGVLAVLFLPGTIVHEFAHAAFAHALGVYVGEIELMPKIEGKNIKLGSVQVAGCDPFRRFLIGVAPVITGTALIFLTLGIFQKLGYGFGWWAALLVYYLIFQIGNTMFSSRRDLEGAIELLAALVLVFGLLHLLGVQFSFEKLPNLLEKSVSFFRFANGAFIKIILVDLTVIAAAIGGNVIFRRRLIV